MRMRDADADVDAAVDADVDPDATRIGPCTTSNSLNNRTVSSSARYAFHTPVKNDTLKALKVPHNFLTPPAPGCSKISFSVMFFVIGLSVFFDLIYTPPKKSKNILSINI